jgi:hypothetical protein
LSVKCAKERGELEGIRVCRDTPMVSHLLFADDSLILMQANKANADALKLLLDRYCASSGQQVGDAKSSIFSVRIHMLMSKLKYVNR